MKAWVLISLFASLASAQYASPSSSAPATQASGGASLIPSDISSGCSSFLKSLDSDSSLTACTESMLKSTAKFGSAGNHSKADVTSAINDICNDDVSSACPDSLMRGKLANFYSACSSELTSSPNEKVRSLYDTMYALLPMKRAVCSKDDNGNYCLFSNDANSTANLPTTTDKGLDLSSFATGNIAFLFRNANMSSSALCTPCTRNIMSGYFTYESDSVYSPGLANSQMLGGQTVLVGAIEKTCGANFLNGAVQAAGGIKQGGFNSGAAQDRVSGTVVALAGALTVAISALL